MRNKHLMVLLLLLMPVLASAQDDTCLKNEKNYVTSTFDETDFLAADQGVSVGDDLELDTSELDLENLVLGLEQPFYVDYLSEGAGASHLFGFFFLDIDTDKDGFADFFETTPTSDLDGDGLVNQDDDDDDGDGILDSAENAPAGVNSMPASLFRNADVAIANSENGNYWQFVPNSVITEGEYAGYFEHPGAYLYIDNNDDDIPDVLAYNTNGTPPYTTDKGYGTTHTEIGGTFLGLLGNDWTYEGTPGSTTADKYHWTGSTIYYIADDDGDTEQADQYTNRLPYRTGSGNPLYEDIFNSTNAAPDYLIYGTNDPESDDIPEVLTEDNGSGGRRFVQDNRGQDMYTYRWYQANISGSRELVFFLNVFYYSAWSDVNTYYSKSAFNPDPSEYNGYGRSDADSGITNGDQFGRVDTDLTGDEATNWFPGFHADAELDALAVRVWGGTVTGWTDIATIPTNWRDPPVLRTGGDLKAPGATQEWVDKWENFNRDRPIIQYRALADWFSGTAVDANTIINGRYDIDMSLEGDSSIIRAYDSKMVHMMVGAPAATKDAWLLGWEDLFWGGDRDYEDVVFYVKRRAGGELVSLNVADDIGVGSSEDAEYSLSQISFSFEDNFLDEYWETEGRYIAYFYRLAQNDEWIPLLGDDSEDNAHHNRTVDKFQTSFGGSTTLLDDGITVRRTVTIPVEEKKQELYWKVQMASENVDSAFQPKVTGATVGYQSLVHDFYYNGAVIPNSNINYISAHETPSYDWGEQRNRGHLYALQTFLHGNPLVIAQVGDGDSPELTPTTQPVSMFQADADSTAVNLYKWDSGVTMITDLEASKERTIYSYTVNNSSNWRTDLASAKVTLDRNATTLSDALLHTFDLSGDKTTANVWVDNFHNPSAENRDSNAAAIWLINWIHGHENPVISDAGVESDAAIREWVLGGINRASPTVIRAPGRPSWLSRSTAISVADKRGYLAFAESQSDIATRLLIGTDSGLIHSIDAGKWIGQPKTDPDTEEEFEWAGGHYEDDNYGTGGEVWAFLPGHLLDDIKYNYTHANDIVAKSDATAVSLIANDGSDWRRIVVFTQGYKAGTQVIGGGDRIGNVVWAMDLTDIDNPIPLWQRSDGNSQDIVNPVAMGWMLYGTTPRWVAVYPTGGSPVFEKKPAFRIVDAFTGENIRNRSVGSSTSHGVETMLGTPALMDTDADGYIDHVFAATSEGRIVAYDTVSNSIETVTVADESFYLAPNIDLDADGNVKLIAASSDNPLIYDDVATPFTNTIYYYKYNVSEAAWSQEGTIDLPINHKAFSRPKLIGDQLVVGTTTGDTFNFCDADPDDPGSLLLYDLSAIGTDDVLEYEIEDFGSVLAPIVVSDNRVLAHGSGSQSDDPNAKGSVHALRQLPQAKEVTSFSIADIFGVSSWQDDLIQALRSPPEVVDP